jgi:hypothetical protein
VWDGDWGNGEKVNGYNRSDLTVFGVHVTCQWVMWRIERIKLSNRCFWVAWKSSWRSLWKSGLRGELCEWRNGRKSGINERCFKKIINMEHRMVIKRIGWKSTCHHLLLSDIETSFGSDEDRKR